MLVRRLALTALIAAMLGAPARAESYVVSPKASDETKAAVAAGRPPEHGFPQIENVAWQSPPALHPGSHVQATVETSANVHYVEGRVKYWNFPFHEIAPGKFSLDYRVPLLPPNAWGHWDVEVIARSVDGVEVKRSYPVTYGW
jgi:hypothetical protein